MRKQNYDFRMCKYCGGMVREDSAFTRAGNLCKDGPYCSIECANAVNGFDLRLQNEHAFDSCVLEEERFACADAMRHNPLADLIDKETPEPQDNRHARIARILIHSRDVDPRLPDILIGLAKGETQEAIAKRHGMTRPNIFKLLKKMRTTTSIAKTSA